ncbi:n-acetylglucosamine-6-sulfatase [Caerostris extrusa]|uniref:N-acetylglucosamine-6-sulfatase n=1 Tax=Caerostris extrusa TaxID=172846 RepID=A0AAV4VFF0_CAEEX|nr:n-acetylglucosamine-6-sulfatase [Caerostris extrusa]
MRHTYLTRHLSWQVSCLLLTHLFVPITLKVFSSLPEVSPMKNTLSIVKKHGAEFTNMFVTTPLCCPSRASILTGKYAHNHEVRNNSVSGNCNSLNWQHEHEDKTFITHFKKRGYSTFYAGKYLNQYGKKTDGVKHIPSGWNKWVGLVGNSCYYNYSLSVNGKEVKHGSDPQNDYLTNVIMKYSLNFLSQQNDTTPFFMFLSPPAPHGPFLPFPKYKNKYYNISAPRTPNFGVGGERRKHWLVRQTPKSLSKSVIETIDDVFRNRWRTLLSVDNMVKGIYLELKKKGLLRNTYIFYTSDNGFHLGQFSLPWDKRQLYEFDVRVPLLVRGPGIKKDIEIKHPVLNIDLAPTFLELADIPIPNDFDGESFASYFKHSNKMLKNRTFIIEHQGESTDASIPGCPQYKAGEVHTCEIDCICEDSWNNTYLCVRQLSEKENLISCIFNDRGVW